jgi:hypothetical protein
MSVKPKNTNESLSQLKKPGSSELAGPKHKAVASDLKMNVDSNKESLRNTAPAKQRGGHNKK